MNTQQRRFELPILLFSLFLAFFGISLVIPVMPTFMNELSISGSVVGSLMAVFALTQLFASPFTGRMADKVGRKITIIIGLIVFSLSELLFGIAKNVELLFASRIFGGLSAAFIMPASTAFITDITTIKSRPKALGYMSAAISTGFIIGPGIGGFLAEFGTRMPFYFAAGFGMLACLLAVFLLKEPERNIENVSSTSQENKSSIKRVFSPIFFIPLMTIFISSFGLAAFDSLFSLYTDHKFGFTPMDISIMITGGAIIGAVAQVALFDRMTVWWGEIRLVRYCLLLSIVLVFLMTVVENYISIMVVTFTVFVGFDLIRPAVTNYLSKLAGDEQGFIGGMNSMFSSLGMVFGPLVGGVLFDIDLNYPFYFAAIVLVIGYIFAIFWRMERKQQQTFNETTTEL